MDVKLEIEKMKQLTQLTHKITSLKVEISALEHSRRSLMEDYLDDSLISEFANKNDTILTQYMD